jgi:hypothetical protein
MALRNLLHQCDWHLGLAHDPSLSLLRPMPTNPLALIGSLPTFTVCLDPVHPAPRTP